MWSPGLRLLTVGLVLLVTLVASEALAVATVMPEVEADLGDLWLYGWVFSAFFLGNLVGLVVAGQACDRMKPDFILTIVIIGREAVTAGMVHGIRRGASL